MKKLHPNLGGDILILYICIKAMEPLSFNNLFMKSLVMIITN